MELSDVKVLCQSKKRKPKAGMSLVIVCICLWILCLAVVDWQPVNEVRSVVREAMGGEDYGNYGKRIFVDEVLPGITQVLSEGLYVKRDIFMPAQGTISREFERESFESVEISTKSGGSVYACRDGIVSKIEGGGTVILTHEDGESSAYEGLELVTVRVGQTVKKADLIGATSDKIVFTYQDGAGRKLDPVSLVFK